MNQIGSIDPNQIASIATQLSSIASAHTEQCLTFGQLFDIYFRQHALLQNKRPQNARYFNQCHGMHWTGVPINQITRPAVMEWFTAISTERGLSAANRALNTMSAVIAWGIDYGYIAPIANPCKRIKRFPLQARERFLTTAEIERFAAALQQEQPLWQDFFLLCLLTAARRGNVQSMRWRDIDFDFRTWRIPGEQFKNGASHTIPLGTLAIAVLQRRRLANCDSEWVFPSSRSPGKPITEPKRAWNRLLKRSELPDVRMHDLRRSFASHLAMDGTSPYQIGRALGHKDTRSTAVYARLDLESVRQPMEALHSKLSPVLSAVLSSEIAGPRQREAQAHSAESDNQSVDSIELSLSPGEVIIAERRILSAFANGGSRTKKELYSKLGGKLGVDKFDLQYILDQLVERKVLDVFWDTSGYNTHQRYKLASLITVVTDEPGTWLAPQQQAVLHCIAKGLKNREIAEKLSLSIHTVKAYVKDVLRKLSVTGRCEAGRKAIAYELVQS